MCYMDRFDEISFFFLFFLFSKRKEKNNQKYLTGSLGNSVAADKMASSLSMRSIRSIVLSDKISSINCIDSVKLGGSEFRGENVVGPVNELSDGTLSKLGYSWSTVSGSMSSSESLFDLHLNLTRNERTTTKICILEKMNSFIEEAT